MRTVSGRWRRQLALLFTLSMTHASLSPPAIACGYHDDVTLARAALTWTYPNSLYVVGAISEAVGARLLPPPSRARPDLLGSAYRRTAGWLEQLAHNVQTAPNPAFLSVSIVLIERVLWSRFEIDQAGVRSFFHADGPITGGLVLVTGESVIQEIAERRITIGEAETIGVIRLYGTEDQIARFRAAYSDVGGGGTGGQQTVKR